MTTSSGIAKRIEAISIPLASAIAGVIAIFLSSTTAGQQPANVLPPIAGISLSGEAAKAAPSRDLAHATAPQIKVVRTKAIEHDTLQTIAARWNTTSDVLARLNGVATDVELAAGKDVVVPAPPAIRGKRTKTSKTTNEAPESASVTRDKLILTDKSTILADEIWQDANGYWYRRDGVAHFVSRDKVKTFSQSSDDAKATVKDDNVARVEDVNNPTVPATDNPVWIYMVGGAKVEVDEVNETPQGAWYRRGSLSIFLEKSRILRIERELPQVAAKGTPGKRWSERGWSTGNNRTDGLIRENGVRFGVDPYLIFCVMEQESHFNAHAESPKGARGLMQLMPGTAARFGVRRPFDAAQNISGGTRYLKMLLGSFNGRVDLVLASYNAGEGAVAKYGHKVPPYKETRNYVKKISIRYDKLKPVVAAKAPTGKDTVAKAQ